VQPRFQIEYDGCPYGCGVIIRDLTVGTELNTLSGLLLAGGLKFPFDLTNPATGKMDSRYQNCCEFIGVTLGLLLLAKLGISHQTIRLKGDSVASLEWATLEHFRGVINRRASFVYMFLAMQYNMHVGESEHCEGKSHIWCDSLSRGITPQALGIPDDRCYDFSRDRVAMDMVHLCNPRPDHEIMDEQSFWAFWSEARTLVASVGPTSI